MPFNPKKKPVAISLGSGILLILIALVYFQKNHTPDHESTSTNLSTIPARNPDGDSGNKSLATPTSPEQGRTLASLPTSSTNKLVETSKETNGSESPRVLLKDGASPALSTKPEASGPAVVAKGNAQPSSPSAQTAKEEKPPEPVPACFTVSYSHAALKDHKDSDDCASHRNLIKLAHLDVNPKAVCVRVDGSPVAFEWVKGNILLGPIAGPKSKITVRYCTGKETCNEACPLPKDEFMAALGGDDQKVADRKPSGKAVQWDSSDTKRDGDVSGSVEDEMARELADRSDLALFEGWVKGGETPSCVKPVKTLVSQRQ